MKQPIEIVITGGPCSGKTKALSQMRERLSERGLMPLLCPEVATQIILSGYRPGVIEMPQFQAVCTPMQIMQRELYRDAARRLAGIYPDKQVVLIHDRGVWDGKAYVDDAVWEEILSAFDGDAKQHRDSYDAVFHLESTACSHYGTYSLDNNAARLEEGLQEAMDTDARTRACWEGHPNLKVIPCMGQFSEKFELLMQEMFAVIEARRA